MFCCYYLSRVRINKNMNCLIIGGDSKLSKKLIPLLELNNIEYNFTSRRKNKSKRSIFLDLENDYDFKIPKNTTCALIIGGVTDYDTCLNEYDYAFNVNCIQIPELFSKLIKKNIYTVFVSTNTVFKFKKKVPNEKNIPNPSFEYSKLKRITEQKLIEISKKINKQKYLGILRLTKNVSKETSPFNTWIKNINHNEQITALKDLYFSPITFEDSSKMLIHLIKKNKSGIYHLSGENDISYSDFALKFLKFLNKDKKFVISKNSKKLGLKLVYNHHITSLSMRHTSNKLNFYPVSLEEIFKYLGKFIK